MYRINLFLICIVCTINCVCVEPSTVDFSEVTDHAASNTNNMESQEDAFLAQLFALSQEIPSTNDKLDMFTNDMNNKNYKSVLYIYLAPYYLSLLSLYNRIKEYLSKCKNLFTSHTKI